MYSVIFLFYKWHVCYLLQSQSLTTMNDVYKVKCCCCYRGPRNTLCASKWLWLPLYYLYTEEFRMRLLVQNVVIHRELRGTQHRKHKLNCISRTSEELKFKIRYIHFYQFEIFAIKAAEKQRE